MFRAFGAGPRETARSRCSCGLCSDLRRNGELAREGAFERHVHASALMGRRLFAWSSTRRSVLYALAALSHVVARPLATGDSSAQPSRLFWRLLAAKPPGGCFHGSGPLRSQVRPVASRLLASAHCGVLGVGWSRPNPKRRHDLSNPEQMVRSPAGLNLSPRSATCMLALRCRAPRSSPSRPSRRSPSGAHAHPGAFLAPPSGKGERYPQADRVEPLSRPHGLPPSFATQGARGPYARSSGGRARSRETSFSATSCR